MKLYFMVFVALCASALSANSAPLQSRPAVQLAQHHNHFCEDHPDECGTVCRTHGGHRCRVGLRRVGASCHCDADGHEEDGHVVHGHHHHDD